MRKRYPGKKILEKKKKKGSQDGGGRNANPTMKRGRKSGTEKQKPMPKPEARIRPNTSIALPAGQGGKKTYERPRPGRRQS